MADTNDSNSFAQKACGFDSHLRHTQPKSTVNRVHCITRFLFLPVACPAIGYETDALITSDIYDGVRICQLLPPGRS